MAPKNLPHGPPYPSPAHSFTLDAVADAVCGKLGAYCDADQDFVLAVKLKIMDDQCAIYDCLDPLDIDAAVKRRDPSALPSTDTLNSANPAFAPFWHFLLRDYDDPRVFRGLFGALEMVLGDQGAAMVEKAGP